MLSAPQRCKAECSDAQRNSFTSQFIPPFLQRHRCDALPCFSPSPVIMFYIAHIAFPPLLPFSLSPQWFTVQNNKKFIREILVSIKCLSAILGPEMAAPILWTPGKMRPFCRKNHVHKIPRSWGGIWFFLGGGKCRFCFYGREDFSDFWVTLILFVCFCRVRRTPAS